MWITTSPLLCGILHIILITLVFQTSVGSSILPSRTEKLVCIFIQNVLLYMCL